MTIKKHSLSNLEADSWTLRYGFVLYGALPRTAEASLNQERSSFIYLSATFTITWVQTEVSVTPSMRNIYAIMEYALHVRHTNLIIWG